jgi:predicted NAD/FAD-dependent oxidoreductase
MMLASHVRIDFPFDHAEILSGTSEVGGTLAWLSRVSSKPGRACDGVDRWVVLGRGEWSEERLERTPAAVAVEMVAAMRAIAHRFRFALASREVGVGSAFDAHTAIGIAGDWMSGTRVEDAFLSGVGLAGRVLGSFAERNQRAVLTLAEFERDIVRA